MKTSRLQPILALLLVTPLVACASGVEDAYPPGEPGRFEIRTLPKATVIEAAASAKEASVAQAERDALFRRLFRYIDKNDIAMTAPVEMHADDRAHGMIFYLGDKAAARTDLKNEDGVRLVTMPERTVATLCVRGSYTPERLREAEKTLRERLAGQKEYVADGDVYSVYWNSPFMPGPLKKSEVHIPVKRVAPEKPADAGR